MDMLFTLSLLLFTYPYIFYPAIVFFLSKIIAHDWAQADLKPTVSVIISAFNEEKVIEKKVLNTLELDYPEELIQIIVSSDGSTDSTNEIVSRFTFDPRVALLAFPQRLGKTACLNQTVPHTKGDIILFTDANSMLPANVLSVVVRNFADKNIGLVTGWTKYMSKGGEEASGIYSRLEQFIKDRESRVSSCVGADGAIFALRRKLYKPLKPSDINDFVIPLQVVSSGCRVVLDPEVYCLEDSAEDEIKEFNRQVRITNRTLQAIFSNMPLLNPAKFGFFSFFLLSHKLIRFLAPFSFIGMLMAGALSTGVAVPLSFLFLVTISILGLGMARFLSFSESRWTKLCSSLLITLSAQLLGWCRFLLGMSDNMWTPQR
jgi:cellulose synthase/poly-beta-1,6-N-acetylglucosamine synthase-like glycosyltransferase